MADGRGQELEVPVVQAGDGVTQRDGKAFGDAGGELEDALFPAAAIRRAGPPRQPAPAVHASDAPGP